MTRYAPPITLAIHKPSEKNKRMAVTLNAEDLSPDHKVAEMVARALYSFFLLNKKGDLKVYVDDHGRFAGANVEQEGRRLRVSLPAAEFAFDDAAGVALAKAKTWLNGQDGISPAAVEDIIEIRAALRDESLPRRSEETTLEVMAEFTLGLDEAEAATNFLPNIHEFRREFIRNGDNKVWERC